MADTDKGKRVTLPLRTIRLTDSVSVSEQIDPDGERILWLFDDSIPSINSHGGNCCCKGCVPAHERLGPLPHKFKPKCGRTKRNGKPCESPVAVPGDACVNHRGK